MAADFKRPDGAAMARILEREPDSPAGAILRLAWLQGLSRKELNDLTWEQVDLDNRVLLLPDRSVPMEPSTEACLRRRWAMHHTRSNRVILADRGGKPMTPENVSRLAREALNREGQTVSLKDLRRDWVLRQIETGGWAYAARVSGMAVSSLRATFPADTRKSPPPAEAAGEDETEYTLWRIVQQEGSSPAGLAIWLCWQLGLQPGEIAALTWDQVDFAAGVLRLPGREIDMGIRLRRMLQEARQRRKDPAEPQVLTAPGTGRPMDQSRISVVTRTAMIRGGLEGFSLRSLTAWAKEQRVNRALTEQAEEQGWLERADVVRLLGVSPRTAWTHLDRMAREGRLVKTGARYYPAGRAASPAEQPEILRDYLKAHGTCRRQDVTRLLGIAPHQATHLVQGLVRGGVLVREGKTYRLPPENKNHTS